MGDGTPRGCGDDTANSAPPKRRLLNQFKETKGSRPYPFADAIGGAAFVTRGVGQRPGKNRQQRRAGDLARIGAGGARSWLEDH